MLRRRTAADTQMPQAYLNPALANANPVDMSGQYAYAAQPVEAPQYTPYTPQETPEMAPGAAYGHPVGATPPEWLTGAPEGVSEAPEAIQEPAPAYVAQPAVQPAPEQQIAPARVAPPIVAPVPAPTPVLTPSDRALIEGLKARIFDIGCNEIRIVPDAHGRYKSFANIDTFYYDISEEFCPEDAAQAERLIDFFILEHTTNSGLENSEVRVLETAHFHLKEGEEERYSRVQIGFPPVSLGGPSINMQLVSKASYDLSELVENGTLDYPTAELLRDAVLAGANIVFTGEPGSGKTVMMGACLLEIPNMHVNDAGVEEANSDYPAEMVNVIQENPELRQLDQMVYKQAFYTFDEAARATGMGVQGGLATLTDLLKLARGNRIVMGEVRSENAYSFLDAATIYRGSMTTFHGSSAVRSRDNLVVNCMQHPMAAQMGLEAVDALVNSTVDLIVQMSKSDSGQRVVQDVIELDGTGGYNHLFTFNGHHWEVPASARMSGEGLQGVYPLLVAKFGRADLESRSYRALLA